MMRKVWAADGESIHANEYRIKERPVQRNEELGGTLV